MTLELLAAGVTAVLVAVVAAYRVGRKSASTEAKADAAETYIKTRGQMDEVVMGDDPDLARRWLRARGKR